MAALIVLLAGGVAEASHFRYGSISWTVPDPVRAPRTVRFTVVHAWRADAVNPITIAYGDGASSPSTQGTEIGSGTDVAGTRYRVFRFTLDRTYAGNGPYTVSFSGCCWISGLIGSPSSFRVQATVHLAPGNSGSPVTATPSIISMSAGARRTYFIPAFDPDFDPVTCRFATSTESALPTGAGTPAVPSGGARPTLAPAPGGCLLDWDLTRATNGQRYVLAIMAESTHGAARNASPLEVIVEMSSAAPPACTGSGTFVAPVGRPFSTSVTGTNPTGGNLEMSAINLPAGATLTPPPGTRTSPFATTFAWTPAMSFFGTTQIVLINYRNTAGLTATCFLTIQVPSCDNYGRTCTVGVGACARDGNNVCSAPGVTACSATAGTPSPEICDNVDNDCDGMTDESNANCAAPTPYCASDLRRCAACLTNSHCPTSAPLCDATSRTCRTCVADSECSGATPACAAGRGCVQCTAANPRACTGATPVCDLAANRCVQCNTNADCGGRTPVCDTGSHTCRPCGADADCGALAATPACARTGVNAGACVQCTAASQRLCTAAASVCNDATNRCVRCNSDADCGGDAPVCDANTCRACRADTECAMREGTTACGATGACVQCTATNARACTGMTPVCDATASRCVQCNTNAECGGTTPVCDAHRCRACAGDADCSGATPACAMTGACVECTAMSTRACTGTTPVCDADASRCVQCNTNAECAGDTPVCDAHRCRGCTSDMDCAGETPACGAAGRCVQCTGTNTRACVSPTPVCDTGANRCVQCTSDAECSGTAPVCDGRMCRACRMDSECAMREGTTACAPTGTCVQCTPMNATACTGDTPVCDPMGSRCVLCTTGEMGDARRCAMNPAGTACVPPTMEGETVACGCLRDGDCGGPTSGRVCDPTMRRCVDGCWPGEGHNGCPTGQSCSSDDPMTRGICTTTCNRDADCMTPRPYCLRATMATDAGMPVDSGMTSASICVECTMDTHCAGRMDGRTRCIGPNNTCAQCTEMDTTSCMAGADGAACVMGACGCNRDADCGGPMSGRVCDPMARRCVAGCWPGEGHNGCPTGESCTSDDPTTRGICTNNCNRDSDCMNPRPICLRGADADAGMPSRCVECGTDAHCAMRTDNRTRCIGNDNTCAQCTPSNTQACQASPLGRACLGTGLCGCMADADCPADQRCDVPMRRCVPRPAMPDAGVDAGVDAGRPTGAYSGDGCACAVPGGADTTPGRGPVALLATLAAVAVARRRRRAA